LPFSQQSQQILRGYVGRALRVFLISIFHAVEPMHILRALQAAADRRNSKLT
jgi:hypothetical protein